MSAERCWLSTGHKNICCSSFRCNGLFESVSNNIKCFCLFQATNWTSNFNLSMETLFWENSTDICPLGLKHVQSVLNWIEYNFTNQIHLKLKPNLGIIQDWFLLLYFLISWIVLSVFYFSFSCDEKVLFNSVGTVWWIIIWYTLKARSRNYNVD